MSRVNCGKCVMDEGDVFGCESRVLHGKWSGKYVSGSPSRGNRLLTSC